MRRRNSAAMTLTVEDLLALCQSEGLNALESKIRRDTAYAAKAVTLINTIFAAAAAKKAEAEAAAAREAAEAARVSVPAAPAAVEGELTDSRAWAMLADLVTPSVLPDLTDEERSALRAAFMEESRKAA